MDHLLIYIIIHFKNGMKKFTIQTIEEFATSGSQKSWLKKFFNLIEDHDLWNQSVSQILLRMEQEVTTKTTYSAMKSTFLKFTSSLDLEGKTSTESQAELRQREEFIKIQAEQLREQQELAKIEAEKIAEMQKIEAEKMAKIEAEKLAQAQKERIEELTAGFVPEEIPDEFIKFDPENYKLQKASEYFQQDQEKEIFDALLTFGKNVILTGQQGTGKTELAQLHAFENQDPMFKIACSADLRKTDLIGSKTLDQDEKLKQIAGMLTRAVLTANKTGSAMVLLDEGNALIPKVQIMLYGLTDSTRRIDLPEMTKPLVLNKGARLKFVITMNDQYSGTSPLNKPLLDRFNVIQMKRLPKQIVLKIIKNYNVSSEIKNKLFELSEAIDQAQRSNTLSEQANMSVRAIKAICEEIEIFTMAKIENPVKEALEVGIVKKFSEEKYQEEVREIIRKIGF